MKASKPAKKTAQPTTKGGTTASAQGRRNEGVPASKCLIARGAVSESNALEVRSGMRRVVLTDF